MSAKEKAKERKRKSRDSMTPAERKEESDVDKARLVAKRASLSNEQKIQAKNAN
jgi:hypothetical protein